MKTIWGVVIIISICAVFFFGMQDISEKAILNNNNLDNESLAKIEKYDKRLVNLTNFVNSELDTSISSNNTNEVQEFYREAAENKNIIEKTRDTIEFIYDIPTFFLLAIPFIDFTNSALSLYKSVIWIILSFVVLLVLYKAIRTGKVDGAD